MTDANYEQALSDATTMAERLLVVGWNRTSILVVLRTKYGLGPVTADVAIDDARKHLGRRQAS